MNRIKITCEDCKRVHVLERLPSEFEIGEEIRVICHNCELPLGTIFTREDSLKASQSEEVETVGDAWSVKWKE